MRVFTGLVVLFLLAPGVVFAKGRTATYSCGDKIPYCKKIRSCARACYYLTKCDAGKLDRDNDGIPCENVCHRKCKRS